MKDSKFSKCLRHFPELYGLSFNPYIERELGIFQPVCRRKTSELFWVPHLSRFAFERSFLHNPSYFLHIFSYFFIFPSYFLPISSYFFSIWARNEEKRGPGVELRIFKSNGRQWLVKIFHTHLHDSHLVSVDSGSYFLILLSYFSQIPFIFSSYFFSF